MRSEMYKFLVVKNANGSKRIKEHILKRKNWEIVSLWVADNDSTLWIGAIRK